jgi:hypothetical protein
MTALNPATGKRDRATELVVHVTYAGRTNGNRSVTSGSPSGWCRTMRPWGSCVTP